MRPARGHPPDPTWSPAALEQLEQLLAPACRAFGDDLDSSVDEILGLPGEAELEGTAADPPPEADSLHPALDPCGKPHVGLVAGSS